MHVIYSAQNASAGFATLLCGIYKLQVTIYILGEEGEEWKREVGCLCVCVYEHVVRQSLYPLPYQKLGRTRAWTWTWNDFTAETFAPDAQCRYRKSFPHAQKGLQARYQHLRLRSGR